MNRPDDVSQTANQFPALTTDRLLLREFSLEDVPAVFEILRREDVGAWLEIEPMRSIQQAEERVRSRMNLFKDKMGIRWAIALRTDPSRVIGSCGYFSVRRGTATVETGYELHPNYWRQGLMTEALCAMLHYCFGLDARMPVHRVEALVVPENMASIRLLEKLGFAREGLRREFGFWGGRYQDVYLYALLNGIAHEDE